MATDYFNMMKDVVGGYGRGLDTRRLRDKMDAEEARKETLFNQEREQYQRKLGLQRQADAAYADQNTLATVGNVNYGGETGARGLQSAEGDYQREANRTGLSRADMPTGAGAVVATKATDRDFNNAALRVAIAKQDDTGIAAARDKDRALRMRDVYDNVAKIKDSDLETHAAGVNTNGDVPLIYTSKDAKGYTFMTTRPDGTPIPGSTFKATPAQVRQMVLAKALADEGFGPESMDIASKAHDSLNKHITGLNTQTLEVTKGNNTAQKDEVAGTAAMIHAGAAATSAGTHAKLAGLQMDEIKNAQKHREDAGAIVAEYNGLTDAEKTGDKGRALVTKFNILNAKNGGQVSFQTPRGGAQTAKYEDDNIWKDVEKKLRESNTPEPDIQRQREGFMATRGWAPKAAVAAVMSGRDAVTGDKLTAQDVEDFNAHFPNTPVDPATLKWLNPSAKTTGGATPQPAAALPPRNSGPANPYVDKSGRPLPNPPSGPSGNALTNTIAPAVGAALSSSGSGSRQAYLEGKLARREPLTQAEQVWASRLGLVK